MKTIFLFFATALMSLITFGQSPYHNIIVNEKVHFQGDSTTSCYVVIQDVSVNSLKDMKAMYMLKIYKSKAIFQENVNYNIPTQEIPAGIQIQFTAEFTQGDLFLKISESLKTKLLQLNSTWEEGHIIIE